jgi:hypothetical protein
MISSPWLPLQIGAAQPPFLQCNEEALPVAFFRGGLHAHHASGLPMLRNQYGLSEKKSRHVVLIVPTPDRLARTGPRGLRPKLARYTSFRNVQILNLLSRQ